MPERFSPHSACGELVGIGIDGRIFEVDCLRPVRHQAPLHHGDLALAGLGVEPDDGLESLRRGVVGRSQLGVVEDVGIVRAEPLRNPLLVRPSSIPAAHETMQPATSGLALAEKFLFPQNLWLIRSLLSFEGKGPLTCRRGSRRK